jgi:hypothetical protein
MCCIDRLKSQGKAATRHSIPVAAFGKSGQFQSGQFNEYERLLSAKSGH